MGVLGSGLLLSFAARSQVEGQAPATSSPPDGHSAYVGSTACAKCHRRIYASFSQTDMGRSMSIPPESLIKSLSSPVTVDDSHSAEQLQVFARDGRLFQSQSQTGSQTNDAVRETHDVQWIIGAGANGFGCIVQRGDYIFEAPLSFYSKPGSWALSPGYEFANYGFSRPIVPACINCHSGMPKPVAHGNGRFLQPPFQELAIGCENCHGPGQAHITEMTTVGPSDSGSATIVNPAKLTPWLANNICMSCHQIGDARVLQPGKDYRDFRPGRPLNETMAILVVPPSRDKPLQTDLLEHYFSMTLSKCYRSSGARLSCITCHDPHVEPSAAEAPAYFREKCLSCHSEKSCAVPLVLRQKKNPPDDCAGCHMPKRDIKFISHSALTNHRIIAETDEAFPNVSDSPQSPGLLYLNSGPGGDAALLPTVLLQAYGDVAASHPEFRQMYWKLARQLESKKSGNIVVLKALADWATQQRDAQASDKAIAYLQSAIDAGDPDPIDYEQLANLLIAKGHAGDAIKILRQALSLMPFDAEYYRLLGRAYMQTNNLADAHEVLAKGADLFPVDRGIEELLKKTGTSAQGPK